VRGVNSPGCGWVLEPLPPQRKDDASGKDGSRLPTNHNGWVRVTYVVQSDLKGWLPPSVISASMVGMFGSFFGDMLAHMEKVGPELHCGQN
jgi:hypothetical protein